MNEYKCITTTFFHNGLREPGDIVICSPDDIEIVGNKCFVLVKEAEPEHIEVKAAAPEIQEEPLLTTAQAETEPFLDLVEPESTKEAKPRKGTNT